MRRLSTLTERRKRSISGQPTRLRVASQKPPLDTLTSSRPVVKRRAIILGCQSRPRAQGTITLRKDFYVKQKRKLIFYRPHGQSSPCRSLLAENAFARSALYAFMFTTCCKRGGSWSPIDPSAVATILKNPCLVSALLWWSRGQRRAKYGTSRPGVM